MCSVNKHYFEKFYIFILKLDAATGYFMIREEKPSGIRSISFLMAMTL